MLALSLRLASRGAGADIVAPPDVIAPVLTSPADTATGETTADLSVVTDEGNGTLYWVVTQSPITPTAAQVKAGQDHAGAVADDAGGQAVTATGVQNAAATGLAASTAYFAHFMHEDAAANPSAPVSADGFTTPDATAPVLSSPLDTTVDHDTIDLAVTTDEAGGTLYWVVTQSPTTPTAAQVKAGQDHTGGLADASGSQAVAATGVQNAQANGLAESTTYYGHFMHEDAAANQAVPVSGDGATTDAAPAGPWTIAGHMSSLLMYFDGADAGQHAITSSPDVDQWDPDGWTLDDPPAQSVASEKPHTTAGSHIDFDGTNSRLVPAQMDPAATHQTAHTLPDASRTSAGKGFGNTGIDRAPDNSWWITNFGDEALTGPAARGYVCNVSSDLTTLIKEYDLETIFSPLTWPNTQGVAWDASDDTVWVAKADTRIAYHFDPAGNSGNGSDAGDEITFTMTGNINAIAYMATQDALLAIDASSPGSWEIRSCADGALVASGTLPDTYTPDGAHWDDTNEQLYVPQNASTTVHIYDFQDTAAVFRIGTLTVSGVAQVEDLWVSADRATMFVNDDEFLHTGSGTNHVDEFDVVPWPPAGAYGDQQMVAWVTDRDGDQAGLTKCVFGTGEPVQPAGTEGAALYYTGAGGAQKVRLFLRQYNGSAYDLFDWTTANDALALYVIVVDYGAGTVSLYKNGTIVGAAQSLSNVANKAPIFERILLGDSDEATDRRIDMQLHDLVLAGDDADRQKVEGVLAHKNGLEGSLPGGHPYKAAPPTV